MLTVINQANTDLKILLRAFDLEFASTKSLDQTSHENQVLPKTNSLISLN